MILPRYISFGFVENETLLFNGLSLKGLSLNKQGTEVFKTMLEKECLMDIISYYCDKFPEQKDYIILSVNQLNDTLIRFVGENIWKD